MPCAGRIRARITPGATIHATIAQGQTIGASIDKARDALYEGAYEVTPSNVAQTLPTDGRYLRSDITINPIPSNYGLITYNGSTITVS